MMHKLVHHVKFLANLYRDAQGGHLLGLHRATRQRNLVNTVADAHQLRTKRFERSIEEFRVDDSRTIQYTIRGAIRGRRDFLNRPRIVDSL